MLKILKKRAGKIFRESFWWLCAGLFLVRCNSEKLTKLDRLTVPARLISATVHNV